MRLDQWDSILSIVACVIGLSTTVVGVVSGKLKKQKAKNNGGVSQDKRTKLVFILISAVSFAVAIAFGVYAYQSHSINEPIKWHDEAFGEMVGMATGREGVYPRDLERINELYIYGNRATINKDEYNLWVNNSKDSKGGIKNLEDINYFTDLEELAVIHNKIEDLTPLKGQPNLKFLNLSNNNIESLNGIENLTRLNFLYMAQDDTAQDDIEQNILTDISAIGNLKNLKEIDFSGNSINNADCLQQLTKLESIDLRNNRLFEMPQLEDLEKLNRLDLQGNSISKLDFLEGTELDFLDLSNNKIRHLNDFYYINTEELYYLGLYGNPISVLYSLSLNWNDMLDSRFLSSDIPDIEVKVEFVDGPFNPTKAVISVVAPFELAEVVYNWTVVDEGMRSLPLQENATNSLHIINVPENQGPGLYILQVYAREINGRYTRGTGYDEDLGYIWYDSIYWVE